jgi:hypothetical protein
MARARVQREAVQPKNVEALSNARQKEIDEIDARRQAARAADAAGPAATTPAGGKAE